jgi:hypothetical protein
MSNTKKLRNRQFVEFLFVKRTVLFVLCKNFLDFFLIIFVLILFIIKAAELQDFGTLRYSANTSYWLQLIIFKNFLFFILFKMLVDEPVGRQIVRGDLFPAKENERMLVESTSKIKDLQSKKWYTCSTFWSRVMISELGSRSII